MVDLHSLGFDNWFHDRAQKFAESDKQIARITSVNKNSFTVHNGEKEVNGELTGSYLYSTSSVLDLPTVGDWAVVEYFNDNTLAIIHEILERRTVLKRKDPGKKVDYQLVAANVDTAFIMQSADSNFSPNRLERYLVAVYDGNVQPVILLSKSDLIDSSERTKKMDSVRRLRENIPVIFFSNVTGEGLEGVLEEIPTGKTCCLLGSSGVGKTTLLNRLLGEERFQVKEVRSKDDRGRHATTRRQLTLLNNGAILIDTPGMREFASFGQESGFSETFSDILSYAGQCRFSDCSHTSETGCAVLEAIQDGKIDRKHYTNFMKMQRESAFYNMSYHDKRKRDKEFGKMAKQIMKNYRKK